MNEADINDQSDAYQFGHEEGYKAGYDKGWADCEFQQKGALKAMARQVEELNKSTGFAALQEKVAFQEAQLMGFRERQEAHQPCQCELCTRPWEH